MFAGDVKLADFVTSAYRWNTSNVTNMSGFLSGTALTNLDMLSTSGANGFNVSNVKDLSYAFNGMTSLTDISGLANWQINSSQYAPVNMSYMLYGDTKLLSAVPLQDWTVDYADLSYAFGGNVAMHSADLSRWDMRNATVNGLFENNKVIGDASKGGYLRLGKFSKLMLTGLGRHLDPRRQDRHVGARHELRHGHRLVRHLQRPHGHGTRMAPRRGQRHPRAVLPRLHLG